MGRETRPTIPPSFNLFCTLPFAVATYVATESPTDANCFHIKLCCSILSTLSWEICRIIMNEFVITSSIIYFTVCFEVTDSERGGRGRMNIMLLTHCDQTALEACSLNDKTRPLFTMQLEINSQVTALIVVNVQSYHMTGFEFLRTRSESLR